MYVSQLSPLVGTPTNKIVCANYKGQPTSRGRVSPSIHKKIVNIKSALANHAKARGQADLLAKIFFKYGEDFSPLVPRGAHPQAKLPVSSPNNLICIIH